MTWVNFGNKLNYCGFNTNSKKSFTIQYIFNYVINSARNYNHNAEKENKKVYNVKSIIRI